MMSADSRHFLPLVDSWSIGQRISQLSLTDLVCWTPPLAPKSATSLNQFMRSVLVPCFITQWESLPEAHGQRGPPKRQLKFEYVARQTISSLDRIEGWTTTIYGKAETGSLRPIMGLPKSTRTIAPLEMYIYVYLMMARGQRELDWCLAEWSGDKAGRVYEWRDESEDVRGKTLVIVNASDESRIWQPVFDQSFPFLTDPSQLEPEPTTASGDDQSVGSASHVSLPRAAVKDRDCGLCQLTGARPSAFAGSTKSAHILSFARKDLIDPLRVFFDPTRYPPFRTKNGMTNERLRVINHPSNIVTMLASMEEAFDRLEVMVNPFLGTGRFVGNYDDTSTFEAHKAQFIESALGWGSRLPCFSYTIDTVPTPALVAWVCHLRSVLALRCRLPLLGDFDKGLGDEISVELGRQGHPIASGGFSEYDVPADVWDFDEWGIGEDEYLAPLICTGQLSRTETINNYLRSLELAESLEETD